MLIEPRYQLWKIARLDKWSQSRPVLAHVMIERIGKSADGLAIASDGFCLVAVPVSLHDDDVDGMVRADLLQSAARTKSWLGLKPDTVELSDGSLHPRTRGLVDGQTYPDWRKTTSTFATKGEPGVPSVAFDPTLLTRVREALGVKVGKDGANGVRFTMRPGATPILVEVIGDRSKDSEPKPPYGWLMPMHDRGLAVVKSATAEESIAS